MNGAEDTGTRQDPIEPWVKTPEALLDDMTLSEGAKLTYLALRRYLRPGNTVAWPSRSTLAERLGVSVNTVSRRLDELADAGWLSIEQRYTARGQTSNAYTLVWRDSSTSGRPIPTHGYAAYPPTGTPPTHPQVPEVDELEVDQLEEEEVPLVPRRDAASDLDVLPPTRQDVEGACNLLASLIEANGIRRPKISQEWRDSARRMLDIDRRDPAEVGSLMRWCQQDDFWAANVLSMPTFRKKYDQLLARARQDQRHRSPGMDRHNGWGEIAAALRQMEGAS